jgi:hypothetical protein
MGDHREITDAFDRGRRHGLARLASAGRERYGNGDQRVGDSAAERGAGRVTPATSLCIISIVRKLRAKMTGPVADFVTEIAVVLSFDFLKRKLLIVD